MAKRRLIINADDLGLTPGVNEAIGQCHKLGVVTSATLMATSAAFSEAVHLAKQNTGLGVGCHVTLVDDTPLSSPGSIASLLGKDQRGFRGSLMSFARAAIGKRLLPGHIASEAAAQFIKLREAGITVTHFDSHKHTHMFPQVLRPLLQTAREYGIRAVRNPFAPVKVVAFSQVLRRPRFWVRYSEVKALRYYADSFQRDASAAGLKTTDGTFGIIATGGLDQQLFDTIIASIPEGTWEFVCHPGYNDARLQRVHTRLRASREKELQVLTSERSRKVLDDAGIELIHFGQL